MNRHFRKQRGALLVMLAILIIVLVAIAALALDLGRLFVLRSEVQNAVDAAALAAAAELDSKSDARLRARQASRQLLVERGIYMGEFTAAKDLQDDQYTFYSSIDPIKEPATSDADARFVDITIDLTSTGEGIQLFFLPVLQVLGLDTPVEEGLWGRALAGQQTVICEFPPFLMCVDNIELWDDSDPGNDPMKPGEMVRLRQHGGSASSWLPGNFAFLVPDDATGAGDLAEYLAGAASQSCAPPVISSAPGQKAQPSRRGFNTRFDLTDEPGNSFDPEEYPPAPNVIDHPRDEVILNAINAGEEVPRIGDGDWDRDTYWAKYHEGLGHTKPTDYDTASRWQIYQWELGLLDGNFADAASPGTNTRMPADRTNEPDPGPGPYPDVVDDIGVTYNCDPNGNNYRPTLCHGEPNPENFYCLEGDTTCVTQYENIYPTVAYPTASGNPDIKAVADPLPVVTNVRRRVMFVAALNCDLLNLAGNIDELEITRENGRFVEFFMTQHAEEPGPSIDKFELYGEFISLSEDTGNERVIIQLYE